MGAAARAGVDLFTPFGALLGGATPEPEFTLRHGVVEHLFPQYLRASIGREGLSGLASLTGWKHMPWTRPLVAAHLLSWVVRDARDAVTDRVLRWHRGASGPHVALPQPGPSA